MTNDTPLDAPRDGWNDCPGCSVLTRQLAQAHAENEHLRAGYQRSKYESAPCPGCEWDNGKLVKLCALHARIAALEAELAAWPRVYFTSMNPKSLTEGCRVLSVQGHEGDGWFDVTIDADGEEIQAPTDFGLYRTREEAARAAKGEAE